MPDLNKVAEAIRKLAKKRLLVGIPAEADQFVATKIGGKVFGNVSRGFVFEFGSPATNMPARPHLIPGVQQAMPEIEARLRAAAEAALSGDDSGVDGYLGQAGQAAVNRITDIITAHIAPDIKPESYLQRITGASARGRRARRGGMSMMELARQEAGQATPLVDTGSYRNSITWVIRDK